MNKNCVFFGFVLLALALMLSLVNAEIVSSNCEREKIGVNNYELICSVNPQWIQDENGVWQDFNKVVEVNFRNREIFIEWNNNVIELNPFFIYYGNKYYSQEIPSNIWSQVNWQEVLNSKKGFFKFAVKLKKLDGLTAVGFDINSNTPITEINKNKLWGKFGKVGIGFWDLIENNFTVSASRNENNFTVLITGFPAGNELDLDPIITATPWLSERIRRKRTFSPFLGWSPGNYDCSIQYYQDVWNLVVRSSSAEQRGIAYYRYLEIPKNAVIEKVEMRVYTMTNTAPANQIVRFQRGLDYQNGTCQERYERLDISALYTSKAKSFFVVGQYTDWFDLGETAVADLMTYDNNRLIVGSRFETVDYATTLMNGVVQWTPYSGGTPPQLKITFSVLEEDDFEDLLLLKRVNWFFVGGFLVFVIVLGFFALTRM